MALSPFPCDQHVVKNFDGGREGKEGEERSACRTYELTTAWVKGGVEIYI